ncbi:MAG: molybdenum hydroxylase, partial [Acidobacteria bacterium]|nr:molybdenum hydroxylase [Acidobacteriota bacterium]
GASIAALHPDVLIDARMLKRNDGTRIDQAPLVGALGPGYTAGRDCHFVIETERGHDLGRVIYRGSARPDSGEPARFLGHSKDRTVYTTCGGIFHGRVKIGDWVGKGAVIGKIDQTAFIAGISGTVRGILRSGFQVQEKTKIADIDPRGRPEYCNTVSDRTNAIAGGVLEGILALRKIIDLR